MKKTTKKAVQMKSLPMPLKIKPGIFYSPANACTAPGTEGRNLISIATNSAGQIVVKSNGEVQQVLYNHLQWVAIGMPVALGTPIKGLSIYYQIVIPAMDRPTTRTYIVNPSLVEITSRGASLNLLSDASQLNAAEHTIFTTSTGLSANKTVAGVLTCLLQVVIADPRDCIVISGIKLITA